MKPILTFLLFLSTSILLSQELTTINSSQFDVSLNREKRLYFEDTSGRLSIEEVSQNDSLFDQGATGPKDPNGIYWVKIKLLNTTAYDLNVVAQEPRTVSSILFIKRNGSFKASHYGTFVPEKNRGKEDGRMHVRFKLKPNDTTEVYFKGEGRSFAAQLVDAQTFEQRKSKDVLLDASFFGACAILILYTLIQLIIYKKIRFFYLALFAFGIAMYSFSIRGYFIEWVMPNHPKEGLNFSLVWAQLGHLGGLLLAINFLDLKKKFPVWYKVFVALILLLIFRTSYGVYLTAVHVDYGGMTNMGIYTLFVDIVAFIVLLFALWRKVNVSKKVFLIGLIVFGVALILVFIIWRFNYIQDFRLALLYTGSTASLSQVIIFSIALGLQLRQHEVDKNLALRNLNQVLTDQKTRIENKVIERTKEISKKNKQLSDKNERIEILFKEIHHRVKNNLQLISSLLNLQQEWSSTRDPIKAIEDSRSRVVAMSMIHQFLYRTDDISVINFKEYIEQLALKLNEIQAEPRNYNLKFLFDQENNFDIDTSIALGLILNELITNSYKYAVDEHGNLSMELELREHNHGQFTLLYADSGKKINKTKDELISHGFGLRMASRLSRQLQGSFEYYYSNKNIFKIIFYDQQTRIKQADSE